MKMTEKDSRTEDNINCQRDFDQEDEINLLELWQVVWKRRKFIAYFTVIVVVLMAIYSLTMVNIYESKAVITPVESKGGGGGGMAAALAVMGGGLGGMIGLPESASSTEIILLLNSNILREKIIKEYNLLPVLFSKQWDEEKKTWKKEGGGFSLNPLSWISKLISMAKPADKKKTDKKEPGVPDMWDGLRALQDLVQITSNAKEKSITISTQFDDPEIAARLAGYFVAALNDHMSKEARRVAAINKKYLEEQLPLNADPLIKQKIYTMIAQQVETAMMAEVKENFSFKVIDPPLVPDKKIKPKRAQMVVLSFVVALFLAVFIVFFLEYLEKNNIHIKFLGKK
jgi:uncharacterized protein involved in exopolysaccharide biosynthesis